MIPYRYHFVKKKIFYPYLALSLKQEFKGTKKNLLGKSQKWPDIFQLLDYM